MYMKVIWRSDIMTFLEFVGEHPVFSFLSLLLICITIEEIVDILATRGKKDE